MLDRTALPAPRQRALGLRWKPKERATPIIARSIQSKEADARPDLNPNAGPSALDRTIKNKQNHNVTVEATPADKNEMLDDEGDTQRATDGGSRHKPKRSVNDE